MSKSSSWIAGIGLLCIAVFAAGWFLLVSPKLADAQANRDQTASTEMRNVILAKRVDTLREQFEDLDRYKAELAALRVQLPEDVQQSELLREYAEIAAASNVVITGYGFSEAVTVTPPEPAAEPAPSPSPSASPSPSPSPTEATSVPADPAATTGPPVIPGFHAIPLTVTVSGTYADVQAFVGRLQTEAPRLVLVSTVGIIGEEENVGLDPAAPRTVALTATGFAYVLEPEATMTDGTPTPQ